jgi:hypothetical protein
MKEDWEEKILFATQCSQCHERLDQRFLSVHVLIAMRGFTEVHKIFNPAVSLGHRPLGFNLNNPAENAIWEFPYPSTQISSTA